MAEEMRKRDAEVQRLLREASRALEEKIAELRRRKRKANPLDPLLIYEVLRSHTEALSIIQERTKVLDVLPIIEERTRVLDVLPTIKERTQALGKILWTSAYIAGVITLLTAALLWLIFNLPALIA